MNKLSYNDILDTIEKSMQFTGITQFGKNCDCKETYEHLGIVIPIKTSPDKDGDDDDWYRVVHFVNHNVYIKFTGWKDSYEGIEIDTWYEVQPFEKTIIEYKKVNN